MQDVNEAKPLASKWIASHAIARSWVVSALGADAWNRSRKKSVNRRIFAAIVTVGSLTCIVKVIATLKELVIAGQFGVSDELDAFLIAYLLPSFAISVVAGSFNAALIPTYIEVREQQGQQEAQRLLSSVMVCSVTLLLVVSFMLAAGSSSVLSLLGSGFSPEKLSLTRTLFLILLPILPLSGINTIWSAILNSSERFALAAFTPIITPMLLMASVLWLSGACGPYALAIPVVAGAMIECTLLRTALRRQGISVAPRWQGKMPAVKQVMKQYVPMIASGLTMNGTMLVDQSMAAMLGTGSVSTLNYSNRVPSMIAAMGALTLSTAVLPHFSRMVAIADWNGVRHTLKTYSRLVTALTVPVALALILLSGPIVRLLFERGAFTSRDAAAVASTQRFYLAQIPFYVLSMLFVRLTSAFKASHILMWGALINFTLNLGLDWVLLKWLGLPGIAMSTCLVYAASLCYLSLMSLRLLRRVEL